MFRYEKSDVTNWLLKYFRVNQINGNEVNFPCPFCEHKSFYFNVAKSLGFCHHDECHKGVSLDDLIDIVGSEPEPFSGYVHTIEKPKVIVDVTLPEYAVNVIESNDLWAIDALKYRNLTVDSIKKFNIHASANLMYIPVYHNGRMVQYVGRYIDRSRYPDEGFTSTGKRYTYHKGTSISDYLLGWDECKLWTELVLVENSFVSIWLRDAFHCSTNFGSHLSSEQIKKIINSNVKSVILLWDEGAHLRSESAVKSLKTNGVPAISIKIIRQPDNHRIEYLKEIVSRARGSMLKTPWINFYETKGE